MFQHGREWVKTYNYYFQMTASSINWWDSMAETGWRSLIGELHSIIDRGKNFTFCTSDIPTG